MLDDAGGEAALDMVTVDAARVLGITGHGLAEGNRADLVVHRDASVRHVLARHAPPRVVVASGRVVATTDESSQVTWS